MRTSLACLVVLVSASRAEDGATKEGLDYFEQHIRPLLAQRCYTCHSTHSKKEEGGLLLDSRSGWAKGGEQGPAVIPGNPDASLLIRAVRYLDADLRMPPDKPLPKEAVARLEQWVKLGAPDPGDTERGRLAAAGGASLRLTGLHTATRRFFLAHDRGYGRGAAVAKLVEGVSGGKDPAGLAG